MPWTADREREALQRCEAATAHGFRQRIDGLRDVLHEDVDALLRDMLDALTPLCGWSDPGPGADGGTEDYACEAPAVGTYALAMGTALTARHLCERHRGVCVERGWRVARLTDTMARQSPREEGA